MSGLTRWGVRNRDWMPAGMLAIVVAATLVILALLATVLWLSFIDSAPGNPRLIYTVGNFREVFFDARTYGVLLNTIGFSTVSLAVALLFGLPIAWLVERTDLRAKSLPFTLMAVGLLIPGFA